MKKYAIGLIAATLGATSALAAQQPANYDAALSVPLRNGSGVTGAKKSTAMLRTTDARQGAVSVTKPVSLTVAGLRSEYDAQLTRRPSSGPTPRCRWPPSRR